MPYIANDFFLGSFSSTHGLTKSLKTSFECECYLCERYQHIDEYDSFITHKRRRLDLEKAQSIGMEQYNLEQQEKVKILSYLLSNYNDGRKKTFFCVAVNLLELSELQEAIVELQSHDELTSAPIKERSSYAAGVVQKIADRRNVKLRLIKKK